MVRDEADVIEPVIRHMQREVDHLIVADNGSKDGTREILESLGVEVIDDPEIGYYQSRKMSALAQRAIEAGATWIVPFDADEYWKAKGGPLDKVLMSLPPEALVAEAALVDHVPTGADDATDTNPITRIGWRRTAQAPLRKVAVRAIPGVKIHQGNHSASFPNTPHPLTVTGWLEVRHFPYRSVDQFIQKARNGAEAYAATNLPETAGAHWRGYGRILEERGETACAEIFYKWFWRGDPNKTIEIEGERQPPLVFDPCVLKS